MFESIFSKHFFRGVSEKISSSKQVIDLLEIWHKNSLYILLRVNQQKVKIFNLYFTRFKKKSKKLKKNNKNIELFARIFFYFDLKSFQQQWRLYSLRIYHLSFFHD